MRRVLVCVALFFLWMCIPFLAECEEIQVELAAPERKDGFSVEVISVQQPKRVFRVYIYHTHTYEAYENVNGYAETEKWRTEDEKFNMIRVGAELKKALEDAGVFVTHDVTAYEPPKLSTAYGRSLEGLKKAVEEGYDLYIDLHRDAYSEGNGPNTVSRDGKAIARVLFLIGKGDSFDGAEKPDWEQNGRAARWISEQMNEEISGLSRGVALKSGRYNQHAAIPCILIEAGNNKNTLEEVLAAMPYVARGICSYFDNMELQAE